MKSIQQLQLAQNAAARVVKRTPKREHMTPVLRDLHWLSIIKRVQFMILIFVLKSLHCEAPSYVCDLLNWYHPNRHLRSANTTSLVPNRNETITFGKRLMDTASAPLWNFLPDEIKTVCTQHHDIQNTFNNLSLYIALSHCIAPHCLFSVILMIITSTFYINFTNFHFYRYSMG